MGIEEGTALSPGIHVPNIKNDIGQRKERIEQELHDIQVIEEYIQKNPDFAAVLDALRRVGIR